MILFALIVLFLFLIDAHSDEDVIQASLLLYRHVFFFNIAVFYPSPAQFYNVGSYIANLLSEKPHSIPTGERNSS